MGRNVLRHCAAGQECCATCLFCTEMRVGSKFGSKKLEVRRKRVEKRVESFRSFAPLIWNKGAASRAAGACELGGSMVHYRHAAVNGHNIFYREAGLKDAATILLLHGFPTSSHMFRNLIPTLAEKYHVVAPDLPGFGFTEVAEPCKVRLHIRESRRRRSTHLRMQSASRNLRFTFSIIRCTYGFAAGSGSS